MSTLRKTRILTILIDRYRALLWVIIPLFFFIFSIFIIGFFAQQTLTNRIDYEIDGTIGFINTVLDDADKTANEALALLGKPCPAVENQLRIMGMKHSLVRTVNLIDRERVYCTPIPLTDPNMNVVSMPKGQGEVADIGFRAGTALFPDQTVIVLSKRRGDGGVAVVIDTQYMLYLMNIVDSNDNSKVTIKDLYLTAKGQLLSHDAMPKGYIAIGRGSAKFPFQVEINISYRHFLQYLASTYGLVIFFSVIVSFAMSLLIRYWLKATTSIRSNMVLGLRRNEFEPYFQPVINVAIGQCVGVEILARWQHPADGLVSPDVFIPLAEESGLIIPLTQQLMRRVAAVIADTPVQWPDQFYVAVNISALHLSNSQIVTDCEAFLLSVKDKKIQLVLELTERQLIEINDTTLDVLDALRQLGIKIAIDDFGTGYSGLAYLRKLHIDFLKIDHSFVAMIEEETTTRIIVDVVIDLANKLNMKLVAEGVENVRQQDYLLEKQVSFQQGYHFARPMPMAQFSSYFSQRQV